MNQKGLGEPDLNGSTTKKLVSSLNEHFISEI